MLWQFEVQSMWCWTWVWDSDLCQRHSVSFWLPSACEVAVWVFFRSLLAGSLPVTVLWTSSSWGASTAKDRWLAGAETSPSLCVSLPQSVCFWSISTLLFPSVSSFHRPRHVSKSTKLPSSFKQLYSSLNHRLVMLSSFSFDLFSDVLLQSFKVIQLINLI